MKAFIDNSVIKVFLQGSCFGDFCATFFCFPCTLYQEAVVREVNDIMVEQCMHNILYLQDYISTMVRSCNITIHYELLKYRY